VHGAARRRAGVVRRHLGAEHLLVELDGVERVGYHQVGGDGAKSFGHVALCLGHASPPARSLTTVRAGYHLRLGTVSVGGQGDGATGPSPASHGRRALVSDGNTGYTSGMKSAVSLP